MAIFTLQRAATVCIPVSCPFLPRSFSFYFLYLFFLFCSSAFSLLSLIFLLLLLKEAGMRLRTPRSPWQRLLLLLFLLLLVGPSSAFELPAFLRRSREASHPSVLSSILAEERPYHHYPTARRRLVVRVDNSTVTSTSDRYPERVVPTTSSPYPLYFCFMSSYSPCSLTAIRLLFNSNLILRR